MSTPATRQYTIRAVPRAVDRQLRRLAKESGKSLNQVAVEALARGVGVSPDESEPMPRRNIDYLVGSWHPEAEVTLAMTTMRAIDPELWK